MSKSKPRQEAGLRTGTQNGISKQLYVAWNEKTKDGLGHHTGYFGTPWRMIAGTKRLLGSILKRNGFRKFQTKRDTYGRGKLVLTFVTVDYFTTREKYNPIIEIHSMNQWETL